jgi:hypothetical protein
VMWWVICALDAVAAALYRAADRLFAAGQR